MVANTRIEWAHHTFNPWIGCQHVSPACDHCYAETLATARLGVAWGSDAERRRTKPSTWAQPRRWNREAGRLGVRYRVFCASLADVFDNAVDPAWRRDLFALIGECPNLDWLLLTKRIGNGVDMLPPSHLKSPWPNVWLGATIVNQAEADRDIPKLLATPAAKRFLSMEPLLGPVDLTMLHFDGITNINALTGSHGLTLPMRGRGAALDWIIVGGESGPGARPMHPDWARSLRDQCGAAGVPFLFKQWGEFAPEGLGTDAWHVRPNGTFFRDPLPNGIGRHVRNGHWRTYRVGKKAAGRLLDGVQHDGVPA